MASKQPHILFVTSDQQRFDACAPCAPPFLRLPHTERLCHEGINFSAGYVESPVCVPARRSLMMGRSTFTCSGGDLTKSWEIGDVTKTLPSCLSALGYHTALIGKLHVGEKQVRYGFDEIITADAYYREMRKMGHFPQPMRHGLGQCEFHPTMSTVPEAQTLTAWSAEQASDFIRFRRDPSQPLFLWLSFHKPHPPLDPPEPYYSMYRGQNLGTPARGDWDNDTDMPPNLRRLMLKQCSDLVADELNPEIRAAYYGLITQVDYNLGRVFQALMDNHMWDDTLILYTSDHGEHLGDHRQYGKGTALEGSSHVPFILRLPPSWQEDKAGTTITTPVTHCDVLPTLVRAGGGEPPEWSDGVDLLSLVRCETESSRPYIEGYWNESAYWFADYDQPDYISITDGQWKYIWYPEGGREQLFDLTSDPQEKRNLAASAEHDEKRRVLKGALTEGQTRRGTTGVANGELVACELKELDPRRLRARFWGGFHGEDAPGDILH